MVAEMQNVSLMILDVDGTLTDGTLAYSDNGVQTKAFHVADGLGIVMAQVAGLKIAVISGRASRAVETRLAELKVSDVVQNCGDKAAAVRALLAQYDFSPDQAAYLGDDINDLPAFEAVGVKIAVANASDMLKAQADWITPRPGGFGAVRDAVEEILRRQERLDEAVQAYLENVKHAETARQ
jgi:3-deoxy-D-manno-octulosonate 8-phosphate phosphatase (KDO 8-P phosphatase)